MRAEVLAPCLDYLHSPVNHTWGADEGPLAELRVCVEARVVVLSVLSRNAPASLPAKAAAYAYIAQYGPTCRRQHLALQHCAPATHPLAGPEDPRQH